MRIRAVYTSFAVASVTLSAGINAYMSHESCDVYVIQKQPSSVMAFHLSRPREQRHNRLPCQTPRLFLPRHVPPSDIIPKAEIFPARVRRFFSFVLPNAFEARRFGALLLLFDATVLCDY